MNPEPLLEKLYGAPCKPDAVVQLKGDASSRRYYRITLPKGRAPRTIIAMALPEDPFGSDEKMGGDAPTELPFMDVARHLAAKRLRVPEIYLDGTTDGLLLIEDLGDRQLVDIVTQGDEAAVKAWYEAAATLLADMHDAMWPIPKTCIAARRTFDAALLRWELDHYAEWGIEAMFGPLPSDIKAQLDAAFDALAEEISRLPRGFVHRDYQSRNLMVLSDTPAPESFAIIDFQDAFEGPRVYDLAALLNDSYVDLDEPLRAHIAETYAARRGLDPASVAAELRLVTIQRKLKDGGRFIFIDRVKMNPSYLPFVETAFSRARAALEGLPDHGALKAALRAADPHRFG